MFKQTIRSIVLLSLAGALWCSSALGALHGQELREDDPEVRQHLEANIPPRSPRPRPPTEQESELVIAMIEKGDRYEVERALWVLAHWGGPQAAPTVLKATRREEPALRVQTASSLGMLDDLLEGQQRAEAVRELKALLGDEDSRVALAALVSLGKLRAFEEPETFSGYVNSQDEEFALAALRALGESRTAANFPHVQPSLASQNRAVVLAGIEATGKLGNADLAEHLVGKLGSDSLAEKATAIRAVTSLNATRYLPQIHDLLRDPNGSVRREVVLAVTELGGAEYATDYLARTTDPDHSVRRVAAQAIGRFRLENGVGRLFTLFADPHHYVREDAVDAMVSINNAEVRDLAGQGLASEKPTVRECSSQTLGRLQSDADLTAHITLLKDKHLPARRWAAWSLGQIGRKEAAEALHWCAFAPGQDQQTMACAMVSLGKLGYTGALPPMRKLAADKPTLMAPGSPVPLRIAAIRAMGFLKSVEDVGLLIERATDKDSAPPEYLVVREEAAAALGRVGSDEALKPLTDHMNMDGIDKAREPHELRATCQWSLMQLTGRKPSLELDTRYSARPSYFILYERPRGD